LPQGSEHETDFAMLADIFPTGYHATELAQVGPGETVVVMGGGPVGLMAAYSALIKGASKVFLVDRVAARLRLAEQIGAIGVNLDDADPAEQIKDRTGGEGADKGIDAVGFQASVHGGEEQPAVVLNTLVEAVRATGMLGVVGLYVPSDPGAPDQNAARGELLFKVGRFFEKGLRMGSGQANVKSYNRFLRDLILAGRATPSFVVTKELPLEKAPDGYAHFDAREEGWTKVVLHPGPAVAA
jgi:glutathione-independent formaldehyde dehydrogenase